MRSNEFRAIIIGGGIAGPALALLLKKAGTGHLGEPGPSLQATADELRGACREEKERKKALHAPQDDIQ
jgi:flavin-dependent dehydrogenase